MFVQILVTVVGLPSVQIWVTEVVLAFAVQNLVIEGVLVFVEGALIFVAQNLVTQVVLVFVAKISVTQVLLVSAQSSFEPVNVFGFLWWECVLFYGGRKKLSTKL